MQDRHNTTYFSEINQNSSACISANNFHSHLHPYSTQLLKSFSLLTLPILLTHPPSHVQHITMTKILPLPFQDMSGLHISVQNWIQLRNLLILDLRLNLVPIFEPLPKGYKLSSLHTFLYSLCLLQASSILLITCASLVFEAI